ncbi:hypothetical protein A0H81_00511 [Grifola frondosa]|uniref:Uncharacterized protein n=1 Tax=Grifola frondosa TaxID=5627 RepID=A0A1C7MQ05_GRIFR|nr:hypothetical protein A0H81_00511 [Grifola frondosa]
MATTETLDLSESTEKGEVVNGEQTEANTEKTSGGGVDGSTAAAGLDGPLGESSSASPSPGSGLVPLKGVAPNGISSGAVNPPILSMPHPKKFSHVNINKKFLEKTSSTSTSGQTLSTSAVTKTVSSQKPVAQTAPSHSRLVTTKLTASPQPSTTTGPGWSRPSSAVPSGAITPLSATNVIPPPLPSSATASHSAPVPAPVGKVIQPQPRGPPEAAIGSVKKEGAGKSVWANTKLTAAVVSKPDRVQAEFPTAAEVAQGRIAKLAEKNQFTEAAAAHKQAVMAEEDTFRGVHLDPNAHHWDEMEEDDDNFLDGVIEFEDGRQYKVQPAEAARVVADVDNELAKHLETSPPDHPVSKEERFGDDFDRSWPRSRPAANPPPHREHYPNGPASASSSQSLRSPQDSSRVLFNERSNRLEPYSNSQPPRHNGPGTSSYSGRRANRSEYAGSQTELRGGRDAPPHSHLQDLSPTSPNEGSRYRDRETMHRENPPLHGYQMDRAPSHGVEQGYSRDHYNPFEVPVAGSSGPGREGYADDRARRSSTMGPPPLPLIVPSDSAQDHTRQLPPHLSNMRPMHLTPLRTRTSRESLSGRSATELSSTTAPSAHQESHTSAVSHASTSPSSVVDKPLPSSTLPLMDMDEVRKAAMHSAAERARNRRQQEEDEREKEKERARRKAAELEAKMNAEKAKKDTEAEAVGFIEEAVRSIALSESGAFKPDTGASDSHAPLNRTLSNRPTFGHVPSSRGIIGSSSNYHTSFASSAAGSDLPFEGDSWRSRVALVTHTSPVAAVLPAHLPLLGSVDLTVKIDDDLEVVDFSELGKLMGAGLPSHAETSRTDPNHTVSARPPRSVAADFFDEYSHASRDSMPPRSEESSWRRRTSLPLESTSSDKPSTSVPTTAKEVLKVQSMKLDVPRVMEVSTASSSQASSSSSAKHADEQYRQSSGFNSSHAQNGYGPLKSPLPPSYREAPMSTLNDVISRIKGALDGMHTHAEPPMQQKWLPPALRLKATVSEHNAPHEVFDITGCDHLGLRSQHGIISWLGFLPSHSGWSQFLGDNISCPVVNRL